MPPNVRANIPIFDIVNFFTSRGRRKEREEQKRQTNLSLADIIGNADIVKSNVANLNNTNFDQAPGFLDAISGLREQGNELGLDFDTQLKFNEAISTVESAIRNRISTVSQGQNTFDTQTALAQDAGLPLENTLQTIEGIEDPVEKARVFGEATDSTFIKEFSKEAAVIVAKNKNIDLLAENKKKLGEIDNLLAAQKAVLLDAALPKEDKAKASIEVFNKSLDMQTGAYKDVRKELLTNSKAVDEFTSGLSGNTEIGSMLLKSVPLTSDNEQTTSINNRSLFSMFEANGGDDAAVDNFFADQGVPEETIQSIKNDYDLFRQSAPQGLKNALAAEGSNLVQIFQLQDTINSDIQTRFALDKAQGLIPDDAVLTPDYVTRTFPNMPPFLTNSLDKLQFQREAEEGDPVVDDIDLDSEDSGFITKVLKRIEDPVKEMFQGLANIEAFEQVKRFPVLKEVVLSNLSIQSVEDVFEFITSNSGIREAIKNGTTTERNLFNRLVEKNMLQEEDFQKFKNSFRKERKQEPQLTDANR